MELVSGGSSKIFVSGGSGQKEDDLGSELHGDDIICAWFVKSVCVFFWFSCILKLRCACG